MEKDKNTSLIKDELLILKNDLSNLDPNFTSRDIESYNIKLENIIKEVDQLEKRRTGSLYVVILSIALSLLSVFVMYETSKTQDTIQDKIDEVNKVANTADSILNTAKKTNEDFNKSTEELSQAYQTHKSKFDSLLEANLKYQKSLEIANRKLNLAETQYGIKFREWQNKDITTISIYTEQELFKRAKKDSIK